MLLRVVIIFAILACANAEHEEDQMEALLSDISASLETRDADYDVEDDADISELRRIVADHGFNADDLLSSDFGRLLLSVPGMFRNGDRKRFATLNFAYQLACYQGKGGFFLSQALWALKKYNGYGCYCGGGTYKGNYLDATDKCCQTHDHCYDRVMSKYKLKLGCHTYTVPYTVSCCKDKKYTKCDDSGPSAGRELCECDQTMASCVAKSVGSYKESLLKNRSQCNAGFATKPLTSWEILKSCNHASKLVPKFKVTYGSQGTCPKRKKSGWIWRK